jgi:hypothetical protein
MEPNSHVVDSEIPCAASRTGFFPRWWFGLRHRFARFSLRSALRDPHSLIVLAGFVVTAANLSGASWEALEPLPVPMAGMVCGTANGKVIVVGGTNWETDPKKNWLDSVYVFEPATKHWRLLGRLPQPQAYGVGAEIDGGFVVVGGSTGAAPFGGVIRIEGDKLTVSAGGVVDVPAVLSAAGRLGDEIVVVGGTDDAANNRGFRNETHAWDINTGKLRSLPAAPRTGFGTAASVVVGDALYVFGGAIWKESTAWVENTTDAQAFSTRSNAWRLLQPLPHAVRGLAAAALDARYVYLGGGLDESGFRDAALVYDVVKDRYCAAPSLPYRASPHFVKCGAFLYCLGGEDRIKHRSSAAYRIPLSDLVPPTAAQH